MATFEIWTKPDDGSSKPDHSLIAETFGIGQYSIIFYSAQNNVVHAVVPIPGLVIKKTG